MQKHFSKTSKQILLAFVILTSLAGFYALKFPSTVHAAACSVPSTTYGTDTLSVNVSTAGTYNLWVRMEAPSTASNSIMVQLDNTNCYNVGGSSSTALNSWQWINYQNGSTSQVMQATLSAGTHSMEFIGTEPGVSVDRALLLTDGSCVPTGVGANCTPLVPITTPYYMQAGGSGFTDAQGNSWYPDQYFTQDNPYSSTGGATTGGDGSSCTTTLANENCTTQTIAGTTNQQAFQTERWGDFHYDVPVNNGNYIVVLNFAEINPGSNGGTPRLFDVSIEGSQVLSSFNIAGQIGNYTADSQSFPVTVTNGDLNITFTSIQHTAKLSSLEILPSNPPSVSWTTPVSGSTVTGSVALSAIASDQVGISNVSYSVDGSSIGQVTSSPYTLNWDSTSVADGSHTLTVTATDAAGITSTAEETINVSNDLCSTAPSLLGSVSDTDSSPLPADKVDLSWSAARAGTNCTLAGYHIYRNGTLLNSVTGTSYSDTSVVAGTTYTYQISAYDSSGHESAKIPSTALSVTTGINCSKGSGTPSVPTGLFESGNSYSGITLSWDSSTVADGCSLSGYHVYRNGVYIGDSSGTNTSYTDTGLSSGTSYNYDIVAFDSGSNTSTTSSIVSMSSEADNVAPTIPTNFTGSAPNAASVVLSWTGSVDLPNPGAVGLKGYYIYRNNSSTPTYTVSGISTTYTDSLVNPSTTYKYAIAAFDNNGNVSALTADISVSTLAPICSASPTAPSNLATNAQTVSTVNLSWTASVPGLGCSLAGYQIYRNGTIITTAPPSSNRFSDIGLSPSTSYVYSIKAINTDGHISANTSGLTVQTSVDTSIPSSPSNVIAKVVNPTTVQLTWDANTDSNDLVGYNIYRNGALYQTVGNVTSYLDTGATPNSTYAYKVGAVGANGNDSSEVTASPDSVTTPNTTDTVAPSAPSGPSLKLSTSSSITFSWKASADNVGVAGYHVYRDDVLIGSVGSATYQDNGLSANTSYQFTVKAYDVAGNVSKSSPQLTVRTEKATTATPSSNNKSSIMLSSTTNTTTVANNSNIAVSAPVSIEPATIQEQGVSRIDYYLNQRLVYTTTNPAAPYHLDTVKLLNGQYTLTSKIIYTNGKVSTTTQSIAINNPMSMMQIWLFLHHYLLLPFIIIAGLLFVVLMINTFRHFPYKPSGHKTLYKTQPSPIIVSPTEDE